MKKLIPAIVLLLVSAMVLSTSSYAWFSMNRTVTATGMEITATTPSNLYIYNGGSSTDEGNTTWNAAPTLSTIITNHLTTVAIASVNAGPTLTPASTADYATWSYISNAAEIAAGGGAYTENPTADNIGTVAYSEANVAATAGYVQVSRCYVALQKAGEAADSGTLKLAADITATTEEDAAMLNVIRCAVVITDGTTSTTTLYSADGDIITKPIKADKTLSDDAVSSTDEQATIVEDFLSNTVYTVTVYTWFEGQDSACINTSAYDSDKYEINLTFTIE